jgi:hypothetical protein
MGGGAGMGGVAPSTSHACMVGRIPYSCNLSIHTFDIYVAMIHINVYIIHCQNCYRPYCRHCHDKMKLFVYFLLSVFFCFMLSTFVSC